MVARSRSLLASAVLFACLAAPVASPATERNPHPLVIDPAGDGGNFVGTEASPRRTDVLEVDLTDTPTTLTYSMKVVELDDAYTSLQDAVNPRGHDDYLIHAFIGTARLSVVATRDPETGASSFEFYVVTSGGRYSGSYAVPGSFDSTTDTVTIAVPVTLVQALYPSFGKGTVITGIQSFARSYRRQFSSSVTSPADVADDPDARYVVGR
ncbi:MAG TPA: hypothetical protein VHF47_07380 [Acidimicrobiales bacterium]|nr:hypothetical protein [Acidimicrobiales bacterium]